MPMTMFSVMDRDGSLTKIFGHCPFTIFLPEHYNSDGSCKCHDPVYRKTVMKQWGYKASDFKKVGVK